ncbi:hypothetical protein QBC39DRAFT_346571, partial [Podospora conica]
MGSWNAQVAFASPTPIKHLPVHEMPGFSLSPPTPVQHLGNPIGIPTNTVAEMDLTTYNADGIIIETELMTETGDTETKGPIKYRSIHISAGRQQIMQVTEYSSNASDTERTLDVILDDGEWTVFQRLEMPNPPTMTATLPPPYSDLPTDTTMTGVVKNSGITATVYDTTLGGDVNLGRCKRISIVAGLSPTYHLELLLLLGNDKTPGHIRNPKQQRRLIVVGPWTMHQARTIPRLSAITRLDTTRGTTPSTFRRISAMMKTLFEILRGI